MKKKLNKHGYSLTEVIIASTISVLVLSGVVAATTHIMRNWREINIESELNINLEVALERMRQDLRLSSVGVGLMAFYPADATEYEAISFPMARDTDGDGLLDRDPSGKLLWSDTVIYHILDSSPNEFRRTVFSPRSPNATPEKLYNQLAAVATAGTEAEIAAAAMNGERPASRTIFKNLTFLSFEPPESVYDTYAPTPVKAPTHNFGSVVLAPGEHTLTFEVVGKNTNSAGFKINIDRFRFSRSGSPVEGEIFFPANSHPEAPFFKSLATAGSSGAQDMSWYAGTWSGNAQASFVGNNKSAQIDFIVSNDFWTDNNFDEPGGVLSSNCSVKWDDSFMTTAPYIEDKVVTMDKGITWSASASGDTQSVINITGPTDITGIIYGGNTNEEMSIALNGYWARVFFERPAGYAMLINDAEIENLVDGTSQSITFNGGASAIVIPSTGDVIVASDWIENYPINRDHSYQVSYDINPLSTNGWGLSSWVNSEGYILGSVNGIATNAIIGLHSLEVGYPQEAIYRSGVFDTRCDAPEYGTLKWTHVEKFAQGGDIDIRIRSGNLPDCSDGSWTEAYSSYDGYFQSCNSVNSLANLPKRRYFQYETLFRCGFAGNTQAHTNAPTAILRDVTVTWTPPKGLVDLEVDFGLDPAGAIVEASIGGQQFIKSLIVNLEIFKEGPRGMQTVSGSTEIRPLNTGK